MNEKDQNRWRLNISGSTIPALLLDKRGMIVKSNIAFCEMPDFLNNDIIGTFLRFVLTEEGEDLSAESLVERMEKSEGKALLGRIVGTREIAEERLLVSSAYFDEKGNDIGLTAFLINVSDYQSADEDSTGSAEAENPGSRISDSDECRWLATNYLESESVESLMNLASDIAHDFNNIIYGITGYVGMAISEIDRSHKAYSDLQEVTKVTQQAGDYIKKLQELGSMLSPTQNLESARQLMGTIERILSITFPDNIKIEFSQSPHLKKLNIDRRQIERAILNICMNSREAMPAGGLLTIKTDTVEMSSSSSEEYLDIAEGGYFRIIIEDDGEGIESDMLCRIFEPFCSSKNSQRNAGLGMSIAYRIIRDHRGSIKINNREPKGSVVEILLPLPGTGKESTTDNEVEQAGHKEPINDLVAGS